MRADSSLREVRSSLMDEGPAIMQMIHPRHPEAGASCPPKDPGEPRTQPPRSWLAPLQCSLASLIISDANRLIYSRQKDFAVADLARARRSQDGLNRLLHQGIGQHHLNLGLGNQVHAVFAATVNL